MGQYYIVVNVDKKMYIEPMDLGNGVKLMEFSYGKTATVLALMNLLANEWYGDRVYVVGDYAESDNPEEPCYKAIKSLEEELRLQNGENGTLYHYALANFTNVSALVDYEDHGLRYIYNHGTKQFIDTAKCPIEWTWYSEEDNKAYVTKVAPMPLLLAIGNDRGGGDFHEGNNGYEYVGSWCDTVRDIEVREYEKNDVDYEEFTPNFTENKEIIPYTDEEKVIKEEMKKHAELR